MAHNNAAQTADRAVLNALDALDRMNVSAAKGLLECEIDRNTFRSTAEPLLRLTVLFPGDDGLIVVTERYESIDYAWSGPSEERAIIEELVHDDLLIPDEIEVDAYRFE